jgi:putative addiction module component (TIGR02574 family)
MPRSGPVCMSCANGAAPVRLVVRCFRPRQFDCESYDGVMNESVETIVAEAVRLPPDQRLTLAHRILTSVEPAPSQETDAAWNLEILERMARYDAGKLQASPAAEVFAELDRRLKR